MNQAVIEIRHADQIAVHGQGGCGASIRPVSYTEILRDPNATQLFNEYAAECSQPELGLATPQPELYELMERSGGLHAFGVYGGETLIGFTTVLICVLPHSGQKVALTDSIFVSKARRRNGVGLSLLAFIEKYAKENGCLAVFYSAPVGSRFGRMLGASSRYRNTSNIFLRRLS